MTVQKGTTNTSDTAPLHVTPTPKKTSAAKSHAKRPANPRSTKPAEQSEGKHTHEERKFDGVTLGKGDAKIAFRGGERDGTTSTISGHEHAYLVDDKGDLYVRKDEQEGDYRIYQYTTADGEPFPVEVRSGPDVEGTLQRDINALEAERKREKNKDGSVKKVVAG